MNSTKVFSLKSFSKNKNNVVEPVLTTNNSKDAKNSNKNKYKQNFDEVIAVNFEGFVDLQRIHNFILSLFDDSLQKLVSINNKIAELYNVDPCNDEDEYRIEIELEKLSNDQKMLLEKLSDKNTYLEESAQYIEKYKQLIPNEQSRVIGEGSVGVDVSNMDMFKILVSDFIDLAQQFTDKIVVVSSRIASPICDKCDSDMQIRDKVAICNFCSHTIKLRDTETTDTNATVDNSTEYDHLETYIEYIDEFEGKRKKPIPPEVLQTIKTHCSKYEMNVKELSKADVDRIIHDYRLTGFYKSVNLIHHLLTSKPLPNIMKYRKALLERHPKINAVYNEIKIAEGRSNFLNVGYVLKACLQMESCPCNSEDFVSLTTRDALVNSDRLMIKICNKIKSTMTEEELKEQSWNFNGLIV